jgi:HEAT repeat protein
MARIPFFRRLLPYPQPDIHVLAARGDIQGLIHALSYQKAPEIQAQAADALAAMGESALDAIIHALKKEVAIQPQVERILQRIGGEKAEMACSQYRNVPHYIEKVMALKKSVLTGSSIDVWFVAVDTLGEIGDMRALEPLSELLKCTTGGTKTRLAAALEKIDTEHSEHWGRVKVEEIESAIKGLQERMKKM